MAKQSKREVQVERAKQLFLTGKYQQKEIAELVGVTRGVVHRIAKKT